jgi:integrase
VFQCALALAYGAGIERSVLCIVQARDVEAVQEIRVRGTKTKTRDRFARVEPWAWPYVQARLAVCGPRDALCPYIPACLTSAHRRLLASIGLHDYHLHDARHSWAVRMIKAGVPVEMIARQLGHANAQMVHQVYGRFQPTSSDWLRYEANERTHETLGSQPLQVMP